MDKNLPTKRTESYLQAAFATLQWWQQQGRPLQGAFIQGSVAQRGMLLPGSDIDLCIVTPIDPDPHWFEEHGEGSSVVEIYPLAQTALAHFQHSRYLLPDTQDERGARVTSSRPHSKEC